MLRMTPYFVRLQSVRGEWGGLPPWARWIVGIFAIPGLVLLLLSFLAFAVSLLALLLLTVPVYVVLRRLLVGGRSPDRYEATPTVTTPGVKRVEATVVE